MAIGISRKTKIPFILPRERELPKEQQTIFYLRSLSALTRGEYTEYRSTLPSDGSGDKPLEGLAKWSVRILKECLVGWENFKDAEGKDLPFSIGPGDLATDESIDCIGTNDIFALSVGAVNASFLSEEDKKK